MNQPTKDRIKLPVFVGIEHPQCVGALPQIVYAGPMEAWRTIPESLNVALETLRAQSINCFLERFRVDARTGCPRLLNRSICRLISIHIRKRMVPRWPFRLRVGAQPR